MATKSRAKPVGGILNDCILRRLHNQQSLAQIRSFDAIPTAGFSTFGELYGVNINQTLTALFFFRLENKETVFTMIPSICSRSYMLNSKITVCNDNSNRSILSVRSVKKLFSNWSITGHWCLNWLPGWVRLKIMCRILVNRYYISANHCPHTWTSLIRYCN